MRKLVYILSVIFFTACSGGDQTADITTDTGSVIRLLDGGSSTRVVDADNLEIEQYVANISIFLTDPFTETITDNFSNVGFSTLDDYRLVTLPVEPADLGKKDIYVIVNYDDLTELSGLTTLDQMRALTTPAVNKTNNLDPADGFCMYGTLFNYDFTGEGSADIYVNRTCTKYRMTLRFPEAATLSTDNSYLMTGAANYTFVTDNADGTIPDNAYFNFAAPLPLEFLDGNFIGTTYVYAADKAPTLILYTHINGPAGEEYSIELPYPLRNYLYDIEMIVYSEELTRSGEGKQPRLEVNVTGTQLF